MRKTAARFLCVLCSVAMALTLWTGIFAIPAQAAANGIYTATATSHYRHPKTGVIEDSGGEGSEVLGQSMTESALDSRALVEVDANGSTYVTVRLKLMDNIQNPYFLVDGAGVSASVMQEDYGNNTADYRMRVNSESSVITCHMYVVPMGREVIFYITVSNLQAGSGDFITSITVQPAAAQEQTTTTQDMSSSTTQGSSAASVTQDSGQDTAAATETDDTDQTEATEATEAEPAEDLSAGPEATEELSAEEEVDGIAEFDVSAEEELSAQEEDLSADPETTGTKTSGLTAGAVVSIVVVVAAAIAVCAGISHAKKKAAGNGEDNNKDA